MRLKSSRKKLFFGNTREEKEKIISELRVMKDFVAHIKEKDQEKRHIPLSKPVVDYIKASFFDGYQVMNFEQYTRDMCIVYSLSIFEDFFECLFRYTLKTGATDKKIEEKVNTIETEKIIGKLNYGGLSKLVKQTKNTFGIDLSKVSKYQEVKELFARRNVVVHNNSIADQKYCKEISSNIKVGEELKVNKQYLDNGLKALHVFCHETQSIFREKFFQAKEKRPMRAFW